MGWRSHKIGDFLTRSKIPVTIEDSHSYSRVTIRINHNGVSLRDKSLGKNIGTKNQFILKSGQFILSKIDARYGAFGIAPPEIDGAIITGNFWAYNVDKSKVNIDWFNHYTNSPAFYNLCERASSGITHRKYLDEDFFLNHELFIPDIDEQDKYVKVIEAQKLSIENIDNMLSQQLSLLKSLRRQILQDAVQGKLVPQDPKDEPASVLLERIMAEKEKLVGEKKIKKEKPLPPIKPEEIPFEIPEGWVWCRLGEISLYSEAGKSFRCSEVPVTLNEWGVVKVSAVSWNSFIEENNKFYSKNQPKDISSQILVGDFIISRANTSELVGKSVIVKDISKNLLLSDKTIRFKFSDFVLSDFINIYNNSKQARLYYSHRGTGSSPSMKNITRDDMRNLLLPMPSLIEQMRIMEKIDGLMSLCDYLEQIILQNQEYSRQLLQVALREALVGVGGSSESRLL